MAASASGQKQVCVQGDEKLCVIGVLNEIGGKEDLLSVAELSRGEENVMYDVSRRWDMVMPGRMGRLVEQYGTGGGFVWQGIDGGLWEGACLRVSIPMLY